jgi:hypothetical protein
MREDAPLMTGDNTVAIVAIAVAGGTAVLTAVSQLSPPTSGSSDSSPMSVW